MGVGMKEERLVELRMGVWVFFSFNFCIEGCWFFLGRGGVL